MLWRKHGHRSGLGTSICSEKMRPPPTVIAEGEQAGAAADKFKQNDKMNDVTWLF